ncbi:MAG: ABC transporter ATP-binding protein [Chloroflexi bacterium]|nr:ABC transporter ATP-binding protein [Chloroflexota bacterium]
MAKIELINISKTFQPRGASIFAIPFPGRGATTSARARKPFSIENLNLTIPHSQTMVILGPSGCGKTTLLKIIAGLIPPDAGQVLFNGKDMKDAPPSDRRIGMLFQGYALYPHLTVKTNILSYFFFRKKTPELDAQAQAKYKRTAELLGVEIEYLRDRMPPTLSGGEQQRVALGRCITRDPALFLLDEPFSNLDPKLRERYRVNLKTLLTQFNITTVYVTHDQQEAFILADLIAIMDAGKIEQVGTYAEIYTRPRNLFIAEFLKLGIETPPINLLDGARIAPSLAGMKIGARPEDVVVLRESKENCLPGTIVTKLPLALKGITVVTVRVGESEVVTPIPIAQDAQLNDTVWLGFKKYHVFDGKTGLRTQTVEPMSQ